MLEALKKAFDFKFPENTKALLVTEIDGIKELLRSGYQTKEKTGVPVEGGKSLEDRGEEFRKQAREDLYQEMKQKNAREFAEAYVTALKNKDWNLAASMCRPGSKQARNAHLLGKMCDFNDIDIETVYANKKIALAVTEGLRLIDGRKSQLGITLIKESLGWIVNDLDWLPKGEEEKFLKKFVETFPDAKVISKRKTDVQDESEQSDESAGNVVLPSKGCSEAKSSEGLTLNQGREGSISGKVVGRRIFYQKPESLGRNVLPENFERREDSPLPGVKILLRKDEKALDETITVETGHYAFEDLGPGHYTVWALKPGGTAIEMVWTVPMAGPGPWEDHGTSNLRKVEIKSEAQTDVDLHFRLDGVSISGRVTDDNGNPVSGAGVVIELCTPTKDGGEGRSGAYSKIKLWYGMIRTKTDKDGRFKLDGFCPVTFSEIAGYLMGGEPYRRYEVRVQAEGYSPARILVPPVTEHLASETSRLVEDHSLNRIRWLTKWTCPKVKAATLPVSTWFFRSKPWWRGVFWIPRGTFCRDPGRRLRYAWSAWIQATTKVNRFWFRCPTGPASTGLP